jgi:hypothetical protein
MALQSAVSPNFKSFESPKTKWHLDATPVVNHKKYYKGEGGDFPQFQTVVSFVTPCMPVARPCTKSALITH